MEENEVICTSARSGWVLDAFIEAPPADSAPRIAMKLRVCMPSAPDAAATR